MLLTEYKMNEHWRYLAILIVLASLISTSSWILSGKFAHPISDMSDLSNTYPLQLMINDPSLFSKDQPLQVMSELYPPLLNLLMAKLILITGDFMVVHVLLSLTLFIIFISGLYVLGYKITGKRRVGFIYALSFVLSSKALWISTGVSIGSLGAGPFAIAFIPFIILYFMENHGDYRKILALSFVMGLFANIHAYVMGFLFLILLLTRMTMNRFSIRSIYRGAASSAVFFIGAFFILIFYMKNAMLLGFSSTAPELVEMFTLRVNYFFPSIFHVGEMIIIMSPILLLAFLGFHIKRKTDYRAYDKIMACIFIFSIFIMVSGIIISRFVPQLIQMSFYRVGGYIWYVLLLYPAYLADYLLGSRENIKKVLGLVVIFLIILPTSQILAGFIHSWGREAYYQSRGIDISRLDEISVDTKENWDAFYELAEWAERNTPKDALFMIPPRGLSHFRVYSKRSILISQKSLFPFAGNLSVKQYHTLQEITELYMKNSTSEFLETAEKYDVDYIIVNRVNNRLTLLVVFENEDYIIYSCKKNEGNAD